MYPRRVPWGIQFTINLRFGKPAVLDSLLRSMHADMASAITPTLGFPLDGIFEQASHKVRTGDGPIYLQSTPGRTCRPRRVPWGIQFTIIFRLGKPEVLDSLLRTKHTDMACAITPR